MSFADEFMEKLHEMADNLGLEDDDRESFISSSMERKGFRKTFTWADPEPEEGSSKGGDFFSQKRERKTGETRKVGKPSGGANWQYGS